MTMRMGVNCAGLDWIPAAVTPFLSALILNFQSESLQEDFSENGAPCGYIEERWHRADSARGGRDQGG